MKHGTVSRISGPIVDARGMAEAQMYEFVEIGRLHLMGEIIRITGDVATIQVYESTTGVKPGEAVYRTGNPMSLWLGPGLIRLFYDGLQRPLLAIQEKAGTYLPRHVVTRALDTEAKWHFRPLVEVGQRLEPGQVFGHVPETDLVEHRLMVRPGLAGTVKWVADQGDYTVTDTMLILTTDAGDEVELDMTQKWGVRHPRPVHQRNRVDRPLVTGMRVIDTFFPIAKGGAACVPGGFGTGKTMTQQSLAKWSDADIIVYIGCGERGNEMTDVLKSFPELDDPRSGKPLMDRTILIANTSNMPVAAREVSIYTGVTLAEYYRDMGYHVALMADSTSRWTEAMRELSGRLEEMPAEEGFPAYLATRLAQFYERAGYVDTLSGQPGSVSIIGAVSPPGGDFSEPVTRHTQRFVRCFWALDNQLANARHYPAINWLNSYSEYTDDIAPWWDRVDPDWTALRARALDILQRESRLQQIVKLVGPDALPDTQRLTLFMAELLRNAFLAQNAFDVEDRYCSPEKQLGLLRLILRVAERGRLIVERGVPILKIRQLPCIEELGRAKLSVPNDRLEKLDKIAGRIENEMDQLEGSVR
ncbi:MAG: V-type ATP synthase subunit A [Planctomycetota bacterium]